MYINGRRYLLVSEEEFTTKFIKYKSIAFVPDKKSKVSRFCSVCHKDYFDNIDPDAESIICPICAMGLADGVPSKKKKKVKRIAFTKADREKFNKGE